MATAAPTVRKATFTDKAPAPLRVFSQAIIANGMIYVSGNVGMDPATGKLADGGVRVRAEQVLRNLSAVLEAAGSSLAKVVKVNVFLTSMVDFEEMNKAYLGFFEDPRPARTCVQVAGLPFGADVEMECQALV